MQYMIGNGSHITKWLYRGVREVTETPLLSTRMKWDIDLGRELTDKEWRMALEYPRIISRNPKFKSIQLMILHRAYLTPNRLHTIYPEVSDSCPRCHALQTKLYHMIWSCPRLAHYWAGVQKILHDIAPLNNDDSPEHCLLGLRVKSTNSDPVRKFMNLALTEYYNEVESYKTN